MTTPDKDNLWYTLSSRKLHSKLVDFPDYDENGKAICQILIKTLTQDDLIAIQKESTNECDRSFAEDKEKINRDSPVWQLRYDNITAKHFLFRCCYEPSDPDKKLFPTPLHVGKLTQDEVNVLVQHYRTLQNEKGPLIAYMNNGQMEDWVNKLANSAEEGAYFLDRILPEAQTQLLLYMASQLSAKTASPTDKFLLGSELNNSTENTKTDPQLPQEPALEPTISKKLSSKNK
jgi:hypothetical protein